MKAAEEVEAMWRESERKDRERKRRKHAAEWYSFYLGLAESHARMSEGFEAKALALLQAGEPKGSSR